MIRPASSALRRTAKLGLLQDRFFELGISNLTVRHGLCGAERAEESDREEKSCRVHRWSDLWGSVSVGQWADNVILPLARSRAASRVQWVSAAFKRVETAVMIWAGAKGLATMRLLGTPFDDHSGELSPLM